MSELLQKNKIKYTQKWYLMEEGKNLKSHLLLIDPKDHPVIKFLDWILDKYCLIVDWIEHKLFPN